MPEFHLRPVGEALFFAPGDEPAQQRRVGFGGVVGLTALVAQILQKVFDERLHAVPDCPQARPAASRKLGEWETRQRR